MEIRSISGDVYAVVNALSAMREHSRFTFEIEVRGYNKKHLKLKNVRLREKKLYCGNHPNECEVNFGASPRKGVWLEGLDWVEFNDRVNDVLDLIGFSANVRTSVCVLRKGQERRMHYGSHMSGRFWQWNKDEDWEHYSNWCGKGELAPPSSYPYGTPGEYVERNENDFIMGKVAK